MTEDHTKPTDASRGISLALSGGAARAIAHIGVLKVLAQAGIPIRAIAGTSGGGVVAVLVAAGYPLVDLERDARGVEWRRLVELRPHPLGILSTEKLSEFVVRRIGDLRFEDLSIPCAVVATDLTVGAKRVFAAGPVSLAVGATCAIPEFYRPVELDGHVYIDGGIVEPLPVETVLGLVKHARRPPNGSAAGRSGARDSGDPAPAVAVSVLQRRVRSAGPRHLWQLLGLITEVVQHELASRSAKAADLYVEPDVAGFSYFDLDNAEGLIAAGEAAMRSHIDSLREILQDGSAPSRTGE